MNWEGDLIMGKNHKGAILTLVERRSKYLCATYLSGKDAEATKNGVIKLLRGMNVKTITESYEKWRNKVVARNECENDNL